MNMLNQNIKLSIANRLKDLKIPFYRTSLFLIADSAVTAGIGFIFWIIVARYYTAEDLGYGSAAISAMSLLGSLSLIGLNTTIIRFLPSAEKPQRMINSYLTLTGLVAIVIAGVFIAGLPVWSPALNFIQKNAIFILAFMIFTAVYTLSNISRNVFLTIRRADLELVTDTIQSTLKIPAAIILVLFFHSFGIAAAWGTTTLISVVIALCLFLPRIQGGYRPWPALDLKIIRNYQNYSAGNYLASLFASATTWIMPIIVVNILDSEANAYFYITWTISTLLSAISVASASSLFVEGSHSRENLRSNLVQALKFTYLLLVPAAIFTFVLSSPLTALFGNAYSINGAALLRLLVIANLCGGITSLYWAILRINKNIPELCFLSITQAIVFLGGSALILSHTGIIGTGYVWLGVQVLTGLYASVKLVKILTGRHELPA
jgi:O-antigen/teichoic acid export membrane protein